MTYVNKKKTFLEERIKTTNSNDLSGAARRILLYLFVYADRLSLNLIAVSLDIFGFWTSKDWLIYKCLPE